MRDKMIREGGRRGQKESVSQRGSCLCSQFILPDVDSLSLLEVLCSFLSDLCCSSAVMSDFTHFPPNLLTYFIFIPTEKKRKSLFISC